MMSILLSVIVSSGNGDIISTIFHFSNEVFLITVIACVHKVISSLSISSIFM